jgi:hypothetical protein
MKLKTKLVAAALSLLAAAPASAALVNTSGGNSSLFLTAWNSSVSYTRDLGTTLDGFLGSAGSSATFAGDALFTTLFGNSATPVSWNIVAGDQTYTANVNPARLLVTGAYGSTVTATRTGVGVANNAINTEVGNMNAAGCSTSLSCQVANGAPGDGSLNTWGTNVGGGITFNNTGVLGTTAQLGFYLLTALNANNAALTSSVTPTTFSANGTNSYWTLASNGTATWNVASVGEVPVPAAVWLLGSGLLGLVGVGRRKLKLAA